MITAWSAAIQTNPFPLQILDACTKLADNLTNHSGASNSGEIEAGTMLADNLTSQSDASNSGEIDAVQSWQTISLIILMS